jgi:hypothetical protein
MQPDMYLTPCEFPQPRKRLYGGATLEKKNTSGQAYGGAH